MARKFVRRTVVASCVVCAGLAPIAPALASVDSADALVTTGVVTDVTDPTNSVPDALAGKVPDGATLVVTPGTDDGTLMERTAGMRSTRRVLVVNYDQSFAPIITGQSDALLPMFAPSYTKSKNQAVQGNLAVMELSQNDPDVTFAVYTGYSQGAEALGDAVEQAWAAGVIDPSKSLVIITSDPRGPWGIKQGVNQIPVLGPLLQTVIGVEPNGARNPADTGTVQVTEIIVTGDPVANWQWRWDRPVSSLAVNLAGFATVHSPASGYGDLSKYGNPAVMKSVDGNTTYEVYTSKHPFTLLREQVYDTLGLSYTDEDVDQWEREAQAFYPISVPSPENAAVPVVAADLETDSATGGAVTGYSVTMSAEAATGALTPTESESEPVSSPDSSPAPVVVEEPVSPATQEPVHMASEEPAVDDSSNQPDSPAVPVTSDVSPQGDSAEGDSGTSVSDSSAAADDADGDSDSGSDDSSSDSDSSDSDAGSDSGNSSE